MNLEKISYNGKRFYFYMEILYHIKMEEATFQCHIKRFVDLIETMT